MLGKETGVRTISEETVVFASERRRPKLDQGRVDKERERDCSEPDLGRKLAGFLPVYSASAFKRIHFLISGIGFLFLKKPLDEEPQVVSACTQLEN